ncbi:MAG: copper resistance protein B [Pseudoxanthomonas sp.]|nr:copper resistance protein B [Pseudoxanthomonas sp.]MBP7466116.1 copper resistance protein B [Pseudoxanthomonas sp.]MBP8740652.1 copper resistance protein B [Pseudoxanthomonas sp.]MBP8803851.1 copper resistance protein B [Pseudoxanthomonas sp.]MBP8909258.1 copper resistance protein B [Pseudoxanthomonas sp.]
MSRAIHALATSLALSCIPAAAFAQAGCTPEHAAMGHCRMPAATAPSAPTPAAAQAPACTPEHAAMGHCTPAATGASAPREAIPAPTDADRAAAFAPLHAGHAHGAGIHSKIQFNRLETWDADPGSGQAWEGRAWFGGDLRRLWLRSEGERIGGSTHGADLEVLYGHATGPWWDLLAGLRHDFSPGPSRTWAAIGVQGLAPYKFEVSATAYVGSGGHTAFNAEVEYELLFSSRLILQPLLEVELHGRDDPRRGIGSGLSTMEAGLRLRYELNRRFAPYLGLVHERSFGGTADLRRLHDEPVRDTRWVAGLRVWF